MKIMKNSFQQIQRTATQMLNTTNMKMKTLVIIFSLSLLITLASGMAVFLAKEKNQPVVSQQIGTVEKRAEPLDDEQAETAGAAFKRGWRRTQDETACNLAQSGGIPCAPDKDMCRTTYY